MNTARISTPPRHRAAPVLAALAAALAVLALAGPGAGPAAAAICPRADATPDLISPSDARKTLTCLVNNERADRDKRRLDPDLKLKRVAQKHTEAMIRKDCLRHECPGEDDLEKRLRRAGYIPQEGSWRFAESIGFARTPRGMVETWLDGQFNRRAMLDGRYRDIGVGVVRGDPKPHNDCNQGCYTYTAIYAFRNPR